MLEIDQIPMEMDPLVSSQQRLLALIKRSHRLFLTMLVISYLLFPAVLTFVSLVEYYIPRDFPITAIFTGKIAFILAPTALITIVLLVIALKKNITFIFTSRRILKQIEQDSEMSQLRTGLTTYITHLLQFLEPFKFLSVKSPSLSLSENLERLERRLKRQKFQESALVVFFVILFTNYLWNFGGQHPYILRQPLVYVALAGVFIVLGLRARMVIKWRQVAYQWIQGFYALNTWGENLERLFLHQQGAEGDDR